MFHCTVRLRQTHWTKTGWPIYTSNLTKCKLGWILGSKQYYYFFGLFILCIFGPLVLFYSVLWIRSTGPAPFDGYQAYFLFPFLLVILFNKDSRSIVTILIFSYQKFNLSLCWRSPLDFYYKIIPIIQF